MKSETATRTALEWLEYEFVKLESTVGVHSSMYHLIEEAMKMEKEQIENAYLEGFNAAAGGFHFEDDYYNKTFNTKEE